MKIEGSIALVTGANRGLGKALVAARVDAGAAKAYAAARDARKVLADGSRVDTEMAKDLERAFASF